MGVFKQLGDNVLEVGVLVIIIIMISILLNNTKSTPGMTSALNTSVDTAVTGIGTPISYIQIIVLVIVFGAIIYFLVHKVRGMKGGY